MKLHTAEAKDLQGGGTYLKSPGKYHILVENIRVGLSTKDKVMDGTTVEMKVMAGEHAGKVVTPVLWNVDLQGSEKNQAMAVRRLTNFFLAANVIPKDKLGEEFEFDENDANGAQIVVEFGWGRQQNENGEWEDDTGKVDFHYANIWHIDDPAAASVEKDTEALGSIEPEHRHDTDWFDFGGKKNSGKKAMAGAAAGDPDFDEL